MPPMKRSKLPGVQSQEEERNSLNTKAVENDHGCCTNSKETSPKTPMQGHNYDSMLSSPHLSANPSVKQLLQAQQVKTRPDEALYDTDDNASEPVGAPDDRDIEDMGHRAGYFVVYALAEAGIELLQNCLIPGPRGEGGKEKYQPVTDIATESAKLHVKLEVEEIARQFGGKFGNVRIGEIARVATRPNVVQIVSDISRTYCPGQAQSECKLWETKNASTARNTAALLVRERNEVAVKIGSRVTRRLVAIVSKRIAAQPTLPERNELRIMRDRLVEKLSRAFVVEESKFEKLSKGKRWEIAKMQERVREVKDLLP